MKKAKVKMKAKRGRKPKYGEQTMTVAYRIPVSKRSELDKIVSGKQSEWMQE